jgi:hypothetical protein
MLCSLFLLELDGLRLRYAAAPNRPEAYRAATDGMVIGPNIGSRGRTAFLRQPVFASDIHSDPDWANFRDAAALAGLLFHNTGNQNGRILDESLTTVCTLRDRKIARLDTYISDIEMVNAYFA